VLGIRRAGEEEEKEEEDEKRLRQAAPMEVMEVP
jgi:hypothetical protein